MSVVVLPSLKKCPRWMQCNANHACRSYLSSALSATSKNGTRVSHLNVVISWWRLQLMPCKKIKSCFLSRTPIVGLCNCLHLASDSLNCGPDVADSIHRWSFLLHNISKWQKGLGTCRMVLNWVFLAPLLSCQHAKALRRVLQRWTDDLLMMLQHNFGDFITVVCT